MYCLQKPVKVIFLPENVGLTVHKYRLYVVNVERPSWIRRDSECGRVWGQVSKVVAVEPELQIVSLHNIIDKFVDKCE